MKIPEMVHLILSMVGMVQGNRQRVRWRAAMEGCSSPFGVAKEDALGGQISPSGATEGDVLGTVRMLAPHAIHMVNMFHPVFLECGLARLSLLILRHSQVGLDCSNWGGNTTGVHIRERDMKTSDVRDIPVGDLQDNLSLIFPTVELWEVNKAVVFHFQGKDADHACQVQEGNAVEVHQCLPNDSHK